jgi:DUF4097 and DUF4098 domain-containing protein YvlB
VKKLKNYKIALIVISALIVGGGIGFVVTGFASAGSIDDSFSFQYEPSSPEPIEDLSINADFGKIIVKYNTTETSYFAEIDVDLKIAGLFMFGKNYLDFFNPSTEWWAESSGIFNLEVLPDVWFDPSYWFKSYEITITVTLRTDVIYDLDATTATGAIEMSVPDEVILNGTSLTSSTGSVKLTTLGNNEFQGKVGLQTSTGSVKLTTLGNNKFQGKVGLQTSTGSVDIFTKNTNFTHGFKAFTSTGSVLLNFTDCLMGDDLTGTTSTGDVIFKSYNMYYSKDIDLNLQTSTGSIDAEIYQYIDMGANVTGNVHTSTGSIDVFYRDNLANTGVRFVSSTSTGSINYTPHSTMDILGNVYSSDNYGIAMCKYIFTLATSTGSVYVNGQSAQ